MDIVDAQVHANMLGTEVTVAIMDALGIQAVPFDEFEAAADNSWGGHFARTVSSGAMARPVVLRE
jgi:hypothetical protein